MLGVVAHALSVDVDLAPVTQAVQMLFSVLDHDGYLFQLVACSLQFVFSSGMNAEAPGITALTV
ncbi:hypothetical protein D3C72_2214710 [compost metagenome]